MIFFSEQPALFSRLLGQRVVLRLWRLTVDLVHTKGTLSHQGSERLGFAPPLRSNPQNNLKTDTNGNCCRFSCRQRARKQHMTQATRHNYTTTAGLCRIYNRNILINNSIRALNAPCPKLLQFPSLCCCFMYIFE